MFENRSAVITGGAGFIGSHLAEELIEKRYKVTLIDNFSTGKIDNIQHLLSSDLLNVVREDLKKPSELAHIVETHDIVFHLAANPEVRVGETAPKVHFEENVQVTFNLLEAIRKCKTQKTLVFASTSTVYGEANEIPTPEEYGPLIPISTYGASKLASEALITSYAFTFGHRALILRLANIVGAKSNHGVVADFIKKIRANPKELEILGDGKQKKSYMYIKDLIMAATHLVEVFSKSMAKVEVYNVGSYGMASVKEIAGIVSKEMGFPEIRYRFTGGVDGGRGWKGDVKTMQLSIKKLVNTGWKPKYSSLQSIRLAAKDLATSVL
jgi:UDP-glucose 4-epimerase